MRVADENIKSIVSTIDLLGRTIGAKIEEFPWLS